MTRRITLASLGALLIPCIIMGLTFWATQSALWGVLSALVGVPLGLALLWWKLKDQIAVVKAVKTGLEEFGSGNFEAVLPLSASGDVAGLAQVFTDAGQKLRAMQADAEQKEKLLQTLVGAAPMAIVLYGDAGRIVYTNATARDLFFEGRSLEGHNFLHLLRDAPPALREAVLGENDDTFTVEGSDEPETYHLSKRDFEFAGEQHTLLIVKRLTREFSRQEVDVWKKVIRVMSHELNNSLAPISSLIHSARLIAKSPEQLPKLDRVFDTISERAKHLQTFLEGYAKFARLPKPKPTIVQWKPVLDHVKAMYPAVTFHEPPEPPGYFDAGQIQQVLINLVKNAIEAGGPPDAVTVDVTEVDGGMRVKVEDRGKGLSPEVVRNALVPFYTTKTTGSGLGLTLCREIVEAHRGKLHIGNREGGGAVVTCWLPGRRGDGSLSVSHARLTMTRG